MERQQWWLLIALMAGLAAAVGSLWWSSQPNVAADEGYVLGASAKDATAMRLTVDGRTAELERRGVGWWWNDQRLDDARVRHLLESLDGMRTVEVEAEGHDLANYGLGTSPRVEVELTLTSGTVTLQVGDPTPVGHRTYIRTPAGRVEAATGPLELLTAPQSLLDRRLFPPGPDGWRRVRMEGERSQILEREGEWWWLVRGGPAAPAAVERLLQRLGALEALTPGSEAVPPSTPPTFTVELGKGHTQLRWRFWSTAGPRALAEGSEGQRVEVNAEALESVHAAASELAHPSALLVDVAASTRITVTGAELAFEAKRVGPEWRSEGQSSEHTRAAVEALAKLGPALVWTDPGATPVEPWLTVEVENPDSDWSFNVGAARDGVHRVRESKTGRSYLVPAGPLDTAVTRLR